MLFHFLVLVAIFAHPWAVACQKPQLSPRDLFLEGEQRSDLPLSVRYSVLRRDADGKFSGVDPSTAVFHAGDRVRLRVQTNRKSFVTVLQLGSSGAWGVLYPREDAPPEQLDSFETFDIPALPGTFAFDDRPGEERLVLVVSNEPVSSRSIVDRLNAESQRKAPMKSRDLSYETINQDSRAGVEGVAVYVSNTKAQDDPPLLIHVKLQHRPRAN
jgi:hypothetical protein